MVPRIRGASLRVDIGHPPASNEDALFRALAPGQSPVGMLSDPAHSPSLYKIEQRLVDALMGAPRGKRRGRTKGPG